MGIILLKGVILFLVLAPAAGGLLAGIDRKITAWLQGRVGPPVYQPFLDVLKLCQKENILVRRSQNFYILFYLIFMVFTGTLLFAGENVLLMVFALTLADIFFVLGAYKSSSPYSFVGAQRELLQIMSYEPALLLAAAGMYMVTDSFYISGIISFNHPLFLYLPGLFIAFFYILAIKFRKSPFDLSTSHHAHQELVKGITTEFSGKALAMIEAAHWCETVIMLGLVLVFFAALSGMAVLITLAVYFMVILVDNTFARAKWQLTLISSWVVAVVFGLGNIIILYLIGK